jgi:hypothetical protein
MKPAAEHHGQRWPKWGSLFNFRGGGFDTGKFHAFD